jgi:hypothetical protein
VRCWGRLDDKAAAAQGGADGEGCGGGDWLTVVDETWRSASREGGAAVQLCRKMHIEY